MKISQDLQVSARKNELFGTTPVQQARVLCCLRYLLLFQLKESEHPHPLNF